MNSEFKNRKIGIRLGIVCSFMLPLFNDLYADSQVDNLITEPPQAAELACLLFPEDNANCMGLEVIGGDLERGIAGVRKSAGDTNVSLQSRVEIDEPRSANMAIQFKFGSAELEPASYAMVDTIARMLIMPEMQESAIFIEGHTDAVGDARANRRLSLQRALSVKQYLVARYPISPERLHVTGKGEADPLTPVNPNAAINRRVEIKPL